MEWTLEIVLVVLLLATLVQALRLERALGALRRDRVALEALIAGFNASTRQAEAGVERLKAAAEGAGRLIERQIDASTAVKDDLQLLSDRGDRLADRLDALVRAARPLAADTGSAVSESLLGAERSEAERSLLQALRLAR